MRALTLACAAACICSGAATQTWEMNGYPDFSRGRFSGISISYDGKLSLSPALSTVFDTGQAEVWSAAAAPDGSVYLGTGNRGRLFRVDAAGAGTAVWTADQPEIFAVTVDSKGIVYAGTSPDGKVYRIENGKATEYFAPGAHYIWALAVAADGALMVATGDEGKIFRVTGPQQGAVYYETGQTHVTALAFDAQGRLLAGSEPNGILYRITPNGAGPGKGFVLYKSNLPEIRAIVPTPGGDIYAAAMGGGVARRLGAAASAAVSATGSGVPSVSTTITVTEQGGINPPPKPEAPKAGAQSSQQSSQTTVVAAAPSAESSSGDRSALYKIAADNGVESLWTSREENIYDLVVEGPSVFFLTDAEGRIYQLEGALRATLLAQTGEGDSTRLLASNRGLLTATGNLGKLLRLGASPGTTAATGWFESPVHDSGAVAKWGRISWHGSSSGVALRTRSGNSARPDSTWSDWSAPITEPTKAEISSPNARYVQWRAELTGGAGQVPSIQVPWIDDAIVSYLPQNSPPVVKSLVAIGTAGQKPAGSDSSPVGTIGHGAGQQIQVVWQADDPDGDRLVYSLYFRGEDESQWKLLRANLTETAYTIDGDALADGRYYFRVVASDRLSNPIDTARDAELVSTPVTIDNTPPAVTLSNPSRTGTSFHIDVDADDRTSTLRLCQYSIDAGPWSPVEASDGVTDSARERFAIAIANLPPGEHVISVRVYDAAGNAGLAKYVVP